MCKSLDLWSNKSEWFGKFILKANYSVGHPGPFAPLPNMTHHYSAQTMPGEELSGSLTMT